MRAATTVIDTTTEFASCSTTSGTLKPVVALKSVGPFAPVNIAVKGKLANCVAQNTLPFKGTFSAPLSATTNDCAAWFGGYLFQQCASTTGVKTLTIGLGVFTEAT